MAATIFTLFSGATANSNSATVTWPGGRGMFMGKGTWDTSTLTLQFSGDGTNWVTAVTALTADGGSMFELPRGTAVRANLSSVGLSTAVSCWIW